MDEDDQTFHSESSHDDLSVDSDTSERNLGSSALENRCELDLSVGQARNFSTLIADAEKSLSHESLRMAAVSVCCKKNCVVQLSPLCNEGNMSGGVEVIRNARLPLVRLSSEERYDYMKLKLEEMASGVRNFKYSVVVNNERRIVCYKAWEIIHGITRYWRKELTRDVNGASEIIRFRSKRTKATGNTKKRLLSIFQSDDLVGFDTNHLFAMGTISRTEKAHSAYNFMKSHFELMGCKEPNAPVGELHIQGADKREIYQEYVSDAHEDCPLLDYSSFVRLWLHSFPHVRLHEFKVVTGKCDTCAQLAAARSNRKDEMGRRLLEDLRTLHRTMYMGEKNMYYKRAQDAASGRCDSMSINTDGMTQSNCEIPHLQNLAEFSEPLKQHIQGVLEHGREFVVYRSFNNVRHGANLAIHCLLLQLENRMQAFHGRLPSTLYIQIDGGGENANFVTLGLCAMLIARRVGGLQTIILTRLPKGHTHEDCDSQFGVIWRTMRNRSVLTPDDYKALVMNALNSKGKKLPTRIVDLFVVPDYTAVIKPCMDERLSNIYKKADTQLQFRFEAVPRSKKHPLGVHTQYRAYAMDEVCEITTRTPTSPLDVGFSAHLVKVQWFPAVQTDNSPRATEDTDVKIATKVEQEKPLNVIMDLPTDQFLAAGFLEGSKEKLNRTVRAVHKYFRDKMDVSAGWDKFENECPQSDSADEYISKHPLHVPLMTELFASVGINSTAIIAPVKPRPRKLEDLPVAHSTASVRHSGNHGLVVPPPRVYDIDTESGENEKSSSEKHRKTILAMTASECKLAVLKSLVNEVNLNVGDNKRRKISVTGNKSELLSRLQSYYAQIDEVDAATGAAANNVSV